MPRFMTIFSIPSVRYLIRSSLFQNARRHSLRTGKGSISFSTWVNTHAPSSSSSISNLRKKSTASSNESSLPANTSPSVPLPEPIEPRLSLTFTCTVTDCGERSTHQFTKRSYEKGIVIIECPGCKNRYVNSKSFLSDYKK